MHSFFFFNYISFVAYFYKVRAYSERGQELCMVFFFFSYISLI
jgi:hypothetical protein